MLRSLGMLLVAGLVGGSTASAGYINLGAANDYNVFTLGNNTQSGSSAEGRVAAGGSVNFGSGFTVGSKLDSKSTNLVVGGNYANTYSTINGNVVVGGTATLTGPKITGNLNVNGDVNLSGYGKVDGALTYGGTLSNPNTTIAGGVAKGSTSLPVNFDSAKTYLTQLSSDLARTVGNTYGSGVTYQYGGFTLTGKASDINVFTIKGSDLASASNMTINATAGSTVVINVDGAADKIQNFGFTLNGVDNQHILFNFSQATSLSFSGVGIQGSVLAPLASINFSNGSINGTMIGSSITGNGTSYNALFAGDLSPALGAVPEPATLISTATGMLMMGGVALRRRCRRAG